MNNLRLNKWSRVCLLVWFRLMTVSGHGAGQAGFGVTVEFFQEELRSADGGGLQTAQIK